MEMEPRINSAEGERERVKNGGFESCCVVKIRNPNAASSCE